MNNKRTQVWMIIASFYPHIGGAEQQALRLSEVLLQQGWNVAVLTRRHNPQYNYLPPAREKINRLPIYRVISPGSGLIASLSFIFWGFIHLARNGRGNIYHAHDVGAPGWLAVLARYLLGGHALIKLRSGINAYQSRYASIIKRWQFLTLLRLVDKIVVVNREMDDFLIQVGIPPEKVSLIPNAVDIEFFHPTSHEEMLKIRSKHKIPEQSFVFLYVGRLEYVKGLDILIKAWSNISPCQHEKMQLYLVGDGSLRAELEALAGALCPDSSINFIGKQDNIRDWYWAADIFVLPSRSEGLSNALVEAMACGMLVLCSNTGGALEIVEHEKTGLLFTSEDISSLTRALIKSYRLGAQRKDMGNFAREKISQEASLSLISDQFSNLYKTLCSGNNKLISPC